MCILFSTTGRSLGSWTIRLLYICGPICVYIVLSWSLSLHLCCLLFKRQVFSGFKSQMDKGRFVFELSDFAQLCDFWCDVLLLSFGFAGPIILIRDFLLKITYKSIIWDTSGVCLPRNIKDKHCDLDKHIHVEIINTLHWFWKFCYLCVCRYTSCRHISPKY